MLSTIHTIHQETDYVETKRKRPRETSSNASATNAVFGDQPVMQLKIPKIVDDYNHNMNGVDIADQMRSNYSTQRTHRRTWLPLFYWCLDTALINAMLIMKLSNPNMEHKDFRMSVAASLLQEADDHDTKQTDKVEKKRTVVKANTKLPSGRFIGSH
ncbi:hypothetical protein MP638_002350, partial [Amoeboaphelidium occidentale]